ncbi:heavy metal-associated domain-containing protein [Desulfosporosinus sp. FKA]|uniref:CopZ family metallochaperone n=1 Tax=Desulfosporosinus sp. FKA TaxID=1969834 RepID=UPI000B499088|nr:heavy metal-associated domain-containing protein [Desulfosporosinus sp. FKA]
MSETTLKVEGMTCNHCKMHVEKALSGVNGVEKASVDLAKGVAIVIGNASREDLVKAVTDAGYSAQ